MSGFNISQGSLQVKILEDDKQKEELAELISEEEQKESDDGDHSSNLQ